MTRREIHEILACLPKGRTLFYYYKDAYAPLLLSQMVGTEVPVRALKRSRYARLLTRPIVKELLAQAGNGVLGADPLRAIWPGRTEAYRLTLGTWGQAGGKWDSWYQTSRCGLNLVLQLNFSNQHNAHYRRLLRPGTRHPFVNADHPVADEPEFTMAWARLDVDLSTGEALIEELQTDWLRRARRCMEVIRYRSGFPMWQQQALAWRFRDGTPTVGRFMRYFEGILRPYLVTWDEAMLAAAIWFLRTELGVRRIYYHTFRGGVRAKRMGNCPPPRSLYTDLPRKFCFAQTTETPSFLRRRPRRSGRARRARRRRESMTWFVLQE